MEKKPKKTKKLLYEIEECDRVEKLKEADKFKKYCDSCSIGIVAIMALVVFMVIGTSYAVYLSIEAMGISNVAGVHITRNLVLAWDGAQGKLYTNAEKNIKDWVVYKDLANGYTIKYPNDLTEDASADNEFQLKKTAPDVISKKESLLYTFVIGKVEANDDEDLETVMRKKYPKWQGSAKKDVFGDKEGLRTGVFTSAGDIYKDAVCWKNSSGVICLESRYYLEKNAEYVNVFDKVISEINII